MKRKEGVTYCPHCRRKTTLKRKFYTSRLVRCFSLRWDDERGQIVWSPVISRLFFHSVAGEVVCSWCGSEMTSKDLKKTNFYAWLASRGKKAAKRLPASRQGGNFRTSP